jgi:hypothetical protein
MSADGVHEEYPVPSSMRKRRGSKAPSRVVDGRSNLGGSALLLREEVPHDRNGRIGKPAHGQGRFRGGFRDLEESAGGF